MSNPWLKKNPYMSMWLSAANRAGNTARGTITSEAKRQTTAAVSQASRDIFGFWTEALTAGSKSSRKKKR